MDLHIGNLVDHSDKDPLSDLVQLDQCPIGVLSKVAQGLSKFLVAVGDDTCFLLLKSAHDAYKFLFVVIKEVLEAGVATVNFRIRRNGVIKVGVKAVPSCIWVDLFHFMPLVNIRRGG
jgi:hypothetical protein